LLNIQHATRSKGENGRLAGREKVKRRLQAPIILTVDPRGGGISMTDDDYPEYTEDAEMGERGTWIVEGIVRDSLGWLFREIQKSDLGIDGFIETLDDERKSKGRLLALQLKTGPSYFKEQNDDGFVFRGEPKHLKYWLEFSLPVLLVLCDPDKQICYWESVLTTNVTRTGVGWKMTIPRSQTLTADQKTALFKLTEPPQPIDFISLALYKLLIEKFQGIIIAQDIETPRDFWGFEYMAHLSGELGVITYIFKPRGATFSVSDVDEVLERREICARGCGWDKDPRVHLFFVAQSVEQLRLSDELKAHLARNSTISYYRIECNFSYGIFLTELDDADQHIEMYERTLS
jgi:hypothetical protein